MLSRCANPACGRPFRYFHEGKIFNLPVVADTAARASWERPFSVAHFWLCGKCSVTLKVVMERGAPVVQPLHRELSSGKAAAGSL